LFLDTFFAGALFGSGGELGGGFTQTHHRGPLRKNRSPSASYQVELIGYRIAKDAYLHPKENGPVPKPLNIKSIVLSDHDLAFVHALQQTLPGLPLHAVLRAVLRQGVEVLETTRARSADEAAETVLNTVPARQAAACRKIREALNGMGRINSTNAETLAY
jgi:hypothetical protein